MFCGRRASSCVFMCLRCNSKKAAHRMCTGQVRFGRSNAVGALIPSRGKINCLTIDRRRHRGGTLGTSFDTSDVHSPHASGIRVRARPGYPLTSGASLIGIRHARVCRPKGTNSQSGKAH